MSVYPLLPISATFQYRCIMCNDRLAIAFMFDTMSFHISTMIGGILQQRIVIPIGSLDDMSNSHKEALLIYEEVLQSYKFKFIRGFSRPVIDIIKTGIPTNERTTSGPPDWEWYFKEQYYPLIKLALDGAGFVTKIITKEDIEKLKVEQAEQQKNIPPNHGQMFKPAAYSIDNELNKFQNLLVGASQTSITLNEVKNWTKDLATKAYRKAAQYYHPDKSPALAHMMSELNTTWAILKEGYYIK